MGDEAEARLGFWVLGALVVAALIFVGVFFWATQARSAQPIRFSHQAHTRDMKCAACHQYFTQGAAAGTPSLADCMDCHEGTQSKSPEGQREEAKIQAYAKAKREGTIGALPTNHSPYFAPVIHPTVETGVETLVVSALAWVGKAAGGNE